MFAQKVRSLLSRTWETVIGASLPDAHWCLASLPVRLGGLGASDPVVLHPQSAVASFLSSASGRAGLPLSRLDTDLLAAVDSLCAVVPAMASPLRDLWLAGSLDSLLADPELSTWTEQTFWSAAVHDSLAKRFDREASDRLERLRLLGSGAYSGAWLTSLPIAHDGGTVFSADEWQALRRFRLGLPFPAGVDCGGCGARQDVLGNHALSCASCGIYARHNLFRDALATEFNRAGVLTRLEPPLPDGSRSDVLLLEQSEAAPRHLDVSVVHPLHHASASSEVSPGAAAARREAEKLNSDAAKECARLRLRFTPAGAETTGAWGPEARKLVRGLARKQSMRFGEELAVTSKRQWRRLSSAVAQCVARCLLRGFGAGSEHGPPCAPGNAG